MFAGNYFAAAYFAPRYFPRNTGTVTTVAFGGWPRGREISPDELWSYQKKLIDNLTRELEAENTVQPTIPKEDLKAKNIAIIRLLRAELVVTEDTARRRELRRQIAAAREEKERLFALEAQGDEEDSEFILFN